MSPLKLKPIALKLSGILAVYFLSYAIARLTIFQAVEHYAGGFKTKPRQDFIALKDRPSEAGWEYHIFLPAIKLEEGMLYLLNN